MNTKPLLILSGLISFLITNCVSTGKKSEVERIPINREKSVRIFRLKRIFPDEPFIKVGIGKGRVIRIKLEGDCSISDSSGIHLKGNFKEITFVSIHYTKPEIKHWVILQSYLDEVMAKAYKLALPDVKILRLGIYPRYFVAVGPFETFEEALRYRHPDKRAVFSILHRPASGKIVLKELDTTMVSPIRIKCKFYYFKGNKYPGEMIVVPDGNGEIILINRVKIEEYLKGVVPWEMSPSYPREALKAQTIAARTHTVDVAGIKWYLLKEPYDITDDYTTQVYKGLSDYPVVDSVVKETEGIVMMHGDKFSIATFFTSCGGILESGKEWGDSLINVKVDAFKNIKASLRILGIRSDSVFACSPSEGLPRIISIGTRFFRWEKAVPLSEIKEIIRRNFGVNLGRIKHIKILEQSESGRVKKIRIVGSRSSITITGDWNIRVALGNLKSSLFVMRKTGERLVFMGGGWGHGIGMCQVGAGVRALKGWTYEDILNFYYGNVELVKIW